MRPEIRKRLQIALVAALAIAALRLYFIVRGRQEAGTPRVRGVELSSHQMTSDDYVVPKKFYAYDLKSARALVGQPVWVKQGYGSYIYPVRGRAIDFGKGELTLRPIEKVTVSDVFQQRRASQEQLFASFEHDGKAFATLIGAVEGSDLHLIMNDVFFVQDPHELYAHWTKEVWQAVEAHEAKPGMNELQANFALGVPSNAGPGDIGNRTVTYANAGHPKKVTFSGNHATAIE